MSGRTAVRLTLIWFLLLASLGPARADDATGYRIAGDYLEGCACRLACPCDFGEDAAAMKGCQATFVWHIEHGRSDPRQRAALEEVFEARFGSQFDTLHGPKFVPIAFVKKATGADGLADEYLVEIPHTLSLKNAVFKDESGKRTVRLNAPGAIIPAQYYAKAVHHTYRDDDWKTSWDFAGRSSFYGRFDYTR